jgi:hypothetical protein
MTDIYDQATMREEQERELSLAASRKGPKLSANGRCHYCNEHITDDKRFCDAECRDLWQTNANAKLRAGKR